MSWPQRVLNLQRMVVGTACVGFQSDCVELRIGYDEIFREVVIAEDRTQDQGIGNNGQTRIPGEGAVVVHGIQRSGKGRIIAIREILACCRACTQMHCAGLESTAGYSADTSEPGSRDIDSAEYL